MLKTLRLPSLLLFLLATGLFFTLRVSHSQDVTLPNSVPRSTFLAYETFGPDWQTTLLLNNTTRVPLVVTPVVYTQDGASSKLAAITLEAHEHRRLSFDSLVAPLGDRYRKGLLEFDFNSVGMGLGAILSSVNSAKSLVVEAVAHARTEFATGSYMARTEYGRLGAPDSYQHDKIQFECFG